MSFWSRSPLRRQVERVELGVHAGRRVVALVEHRTLGVGSRFAVTLGRARPRRLEVWDGQQRDVLNIRPQEDPWPRALAATLLLWAASVAIVAVGRRMRRRG